MAIKAYFDTKPIPASIDPEGGCSLQLKERQLIDDEDVYEEVRTQYSLPISSKLIEFVTECVLTSMSQKVAHDCNPRKIGNLLKLQPTLRGKVSSIYSAYDPATCTSAITVSSLSGLEKAVDETRISFVNSRNPDNRVRIERVAYVGAVVDLVIKKGKQILATGSNMQYITGDTVTATYQPESGAAVVATMVPTESDVNHMLFNWPTGLNDVEVGSEVTITFSTRGGVEEADVQLNSKKVTVLDGELEPIAKTADGKCYLTSFKDNTTGSTTEFNLSYDLVGVGGGWYDLTGCGAETWGCEEVGATIGGTYYSFNHAESTDHKKVTVSKGSTSPAAGTHTNVVMTFGFSHGSAASGTTSFTLTLPTLVVA